MLGIKFYQKHFLLLGDSLIYARNICTNHVQIAIDAPPEIRVTRVNQDGVLINGDRIIERVLDRQGQNVHVLLQCGHTQHISQDLLGGRVLCLSCQKIVADMQERIRKLNERASQFQRFNR